MRQFGTVKSYDEVSGRGTISPDYIGVREVEFEKGAFTCKRIANPLKGERLSYELSAGSVLVALNLQTVEETPDIR